MSIARSVDKLAWLETAHLRHHHSEQCVGCDIERNTKESVGTTLVEHTRELAIGYIELEKGVARRQRHLLDIGNIPRRNDDATRIGTLADEVYSLLNLVDSLAIWTRPRTPLIAINMVQIAKFVAIDWREDALLSCTQKLLHRDGQDTLLDAEFVVVAVGIVIPDVYPIVDEIFDVGVAIEEPQQLVDNALEEDLLGGQQRKSLREVEAHLMTKDTLGTSAGAVGLDNALVLDAGK